MYSHPSGKTVDSGLGRTAEASAYMGNVFCLFGPPGGLSV